MISWKTEERERDREAHGKVVFRKGRACEERPPEPETAACAAWRVTTGALPRYRVATFEEEDTRLRCGEAGVVGACTGVPCLRRKYRGVVVVTAFWLGVCTSGPVGNRIARFRGDGDSGEDARAPLRRRGGGCAGLDAGSVGRGELGLRRSVPSPKSGLESSA
jgi:hypothetical protein